jgi:signal transduction histidine kinase
VPFAASSDGTGIGLVVIRDVLLQLGGHIDVQSRVASHAQGQGTTIIVTIPAMKVPDAAPWADHDEPTIRSTS